MNGIAIYSESQNDDLIKDYLIIKEDGSFKLLENILTMQLV